MPASLTITSFYSFNPSTTIRSAEVNNNFNFIRGHLMPIDGSATAFANNAYDLGSSSFGWKGLYFGSSATINVINASLTTFTLPALSGRIARGNAPTVQRFTTGSGTYTTPAGVAFIKVRMVGGGGGGNGGGTGGSGGGGAAGSDTTFGTSLLTANGGALGVASDGSAGGGFTVNAPATILVGMNGNGGVSVSQYNTNSLANMAGGNGGSSIFGGAAKGNAAGAGSASIANSGSGGSGGSGGTAGVVSGGGGGAGGYIEALIASPSATYSYAVGAGGAGGTAGTSGGAGGAGGSGLIIVEEYY